MARKYHQGKYVPKHPEKYIGNHIPIYRSSWELQFCRMCDEQQAILQWASESHRIPYMNPLTGKATTYVPDFLIIYVDAAGKKHAELIEIKPSSQVMGNAKSKMDKAAAIVNEAKWQAAKSYCRQLGIGFRVITEKEIFNNATRKPRGKRKKR